MSDKQSWLRRSVTAVVKVADRADIAWTTMMVVNTVFVWSAGALSLLSHIPAASAVVPVGMAPPVVAELPREPELMPGVDVPAADSEAPAKAVWDYLCNRDVLIGKAVKPPCPEHAFTKGDLLTLGPLQRNEGDAVYGSRQVTIETLMQENDQ